jgi:hypothetical protein
VALQEIATVAGQANQYAVQHHFGDLDRLIRAIFALRLRWIHYRRADLLVRVAQLGLLDSVGTLLEALFVPYPSKSAMLATTATPVFGCNMPPAPGTTRSTIRCSASPGHIR